MNGLASFARSGPLGVMIFCAGAVREKCRVCRPNLGAERRSSFDENILKLLLARTRRVERCRVLMVSNSRCCRRRRGKKCMMEALKLTQKAKARETLKPTNHERSISHIQPLRR